MEIYVVQPGDNLFLIARRFGVTVAALQAVNQFPNPDQLVVGQAILIPTPTPEPLRYTVAPGDTLYQLAQLFNTTVAAIVSANNITDPNRIQVGTVLVIPGWSQLTYTVQPGDTLFQIASRHNSTVNLIARVNRITDPNRIAVGQVLIIPQPVAPPLPKETIETLAFIQFPNLSGLERTLQQIGRYITYGALFQFPVSASGAITVPTPTERAVSIIKNARVAPLMVITNWGPTGFESDLARAIIGNETVKARTIANLLEFMGRYGFAGVNVDFENMYPEDRPLYTAFIRDLVAALKPRDFLVTLAVPPKYADFPNAPWVGAFDYAALGQLADFIFDMTYEWGWIGGPPGPIAPINLVRRSLNYATSLIPPAKLLQGMPLYGYDWPLPHTPESLATPVNLVDVYNLAYNANAVINYDPITQSPSFRYTDPQGIQHEVWFEDVRSMQAKYELARELNLRGVGWWSYLNEPYGFPQNWVILNQMFNISKAAMG